MNRGLARRPAFENRRDIRFFLSLLARQVREGEIEIHAYSILTTHFHLLVRSPRGELSRAMMWIENQYVRWFNRTRGRDGSLFRGRFTSRRVGSTLYWNVLVRYIDQNPVEAGLVRWAHDYPHGSAGHYQRNRGPIWLERTAIEARVREARGRDEYLPEDYQSLFGGASSEGARWLIERRMSRGSRFHPTDDTLDDLIRSAPESVRKRLKERARIADRVELCQPVCDPTSILDQVRARREAGALWSLSPKAGRRVDAWTILETGLLRFGCSMGICEIAMRTSISEAKVKRYARLHVEFLEREDYAAVAAAILTDSVRRSLGAAGFGSPPLTRMT